MNRFYPTAFLQGRKIFPPFYRWGTETPHILNDVLKDREEVYSRAQNWTRYCWVPVQSQTIIPAPMLPIMGYKWFHAVEKLESLGEKCIHQLWTHSILPSTIWILNLPCLAVWGSLRMGRESQILKSGLCRREAIEWLCTEERVNIFELALSQCHCCHSDNGLWKNNVQSARSTWCA